MKLRNLYERPGKVAAFAVGRMNPATTGHELLVNKIKEQPGDPFLFLTDRAPKLPDNPLTSEEKLDWARKSFNGISIGLAKTVLLAADRLSKLGYDEVTFLEGEDKLYNLIKQYNGVKTDKHYYNFNKINYVQLKRDPEAGDATGMSGTKLRSYVTNNDLESFKKGVTDSAQPFAEDMFKKLQGLLGVDPVEEEIVEYSVKQQLPKIEVLNNIASRKDNSPFPLSYKSTGGASTGGQVYVSPEAARKFIGFYEKRAPDEQELMRKALKSVSGVRNLFNNIGLNIDVKYDKPKDVGEPKVPKNPLDSLLDD